MYARNNVRVINIFVCHCVNVILILLLPLFSLKSSLFMHAQKLNNDDNKKKSTCSAVFASECIFVFYHYHSY